MVEEAVEDGGGDGGVVVEDGGPVLEGFVGGEDDGALFVALGDDLEEEVGAVFVQGDVAEFVENEQIWAEVSLDLGFEAVVGLGSEQIIDDFDGGGEENTVAVEAGLVAQCGGQMGLSEPAAAEEDDVAFVGDEAEAEEVLDEGPVEALGPAPVEAFEGFEHGEAGFGDAALGGSVTALADLAFEEALKEGGGAELVADGLGDEGLEVVADPGEAEFVEMTEDEVGVGCFHGVCFRWGYR